MTTSEGILDRRIFERGSERSLWVRQGGFVSLCSDLGMLTRRSLKGHRTRYAVGVPTRKGQRIHRIASGSVLQMIGYIIESAALPFPAFVLGYVINGIGLALQVRCLSRMVSIVIKRHSRTLRRTVS